MKAITPLRPCTEWMATNKATWRGTLQQIFMETLYNNEFSMLWQTFWKWTLQSKNIENLTQSIYINDSDIEIIDSLKQRWPW